VIKFLFLPLSLLFLAGCVTSQEKPQITKETKKSIAHKHHKMFQTVAKKDAMLLQTGEAKEHCSVCGMNLVMFYKTNHIATDVNGIVHQYCSLHCFTDDLRHGAELKNPEVVDVSSLKFIPVLEAYYVVGSKKSGTMSSISKYAFKSLDDAKKFQKENGGQIVDFYSAWQSAKKDFE